MQIKCDRSLLQSYSEILWYFIGQYSILPGFEFGYIGSLPNECDSTYKVAIWARLPQDKYLNDSCEVATICQEADCKHMTTLPVKYGGNTGEQMATLMCVRSVVVEEQAVAQRLYS